MARLGNKRALTAFTGLPQDTPLNSVKTKVSNVVRVFSIEEVRAAQLNRRNELQTVFDKLHKDVSQNAEHARGTSIRNHNRKANVRPINFAEGDYVLRGVYHRERGRKQAVRWRGPFRVMRCSSEYTFEMEDLLTSERREFYGRRLKFFRNRDVDVTEKVRNHLSYQGNELLVVREIEDIRKRNDALELLVLWKSFEKSESSWIAFESL